MGVDQAREACAAGRFEAGEAAMRAMIRRTSQVTGHVTRNSAADEGASAAAAYAVLAYCARHDGRPQDALAEVQSALEAGARRDPVGSGGIWWDLVGSGSAAGPNGIWWDAGAVF
jgi:hypothetical protein